MSWHKFCVTHAKNYITWILPWRNIPDKPKLRDMLQIISQYKNVKVKKDKKRLQNCPVWRRKGDMTAKCNASYWIVSYPKGWEFLLQLHMKTTLKLNIESHSREIKESSNIWGLLSISLFCRVLLKVWDLQKIWINEQAIFTCFSILSRNVQLTSDDHVL